MKTLSKTFAAAALLGLAVTAGSTFAGTGIPPLTTELIAGGLSYPVFVTHAPGDYSRLYVLEKRGRIQVLNIWEDTQTLMLDIDGLTGGGTSTNNEQGLLGLAFHPDYQENGFFYLYHTLAIGNPDTTVVRYTATSPTTVDLGSRTTILTFDQPQGNHNGGWIGFGPDGYLYIATGDGGGAFDQHGTFGNAQDVTDNLLGKMLRIDIDSASPYGIPKDNPFAAPHPADDEIWAFGLRNPWRCSFDRATGDLWIADVGQNAWEEIDFQPAGLTNARNYGWRCMEGNSCTGLTGCICFSKTLVDPIFEYNHGTGFSITGGYVYRGCDIPALDGTYFYADYTVNRIWSFSYDGRTVTNFQERTAELGTGGSIINPSSFGEDAAGEMYVVDQGTSLTGNGEIWKIVPVTPTQSPYDLDCSGAVDFGDLLRVLTAWGPCDGCQEDLDRDGTVGFSDLLLVITNWTT